MSKIRSLLKSYPIRDTKTKIQFTRKKYTMLFPEVKVLLGDTKIKKFSPVSGRI